MVLLISAVLFWLADETQVQSAPLFSSDLAFQFICKGRSQSALEDDFEEFLRREDFKVLNQGRIQREHEIFLLDTKIIGLDGKRRVIDIMALPHTEGRYAVTLRTPPPTQRAAQLEEALLNFVSGKLGCEVRQITRGENGADTRAYYDEHVRNIENLFRQAEQLRGERRL
jgi:hypothetical protein